MGRNWTQTEWSVYDMDTRHAVLSARSEPDAWRALTRASRAILRNYSSSFFLVTRFLPPTKRAHVDVIYAAVRFPDEIVDTFPLAPDARTSLIADARRQYIRSLQNTDYRHAIREGISPWLAGFAEVVRRHEIPPEHYLFFLDAMAADCTPRPYRDLDDLIEGYIYGSAIVVGYFLACVYGPSEPAHRQRALDSARSLGIALQLTNFLRDVAEDQRRGRVYLPLDLLNAEGISRLDCSDPSQSHRIASVLRRVSALAEGYYRAAESDVDAFAPDCRIAIQACIDVYRGLNRRIGLSPLGIRHRESVPLIEKFNALPASKFWRVPLAYMGGI